VYAGNFRITASGTADAPIVLYGTRAAVLEGRTVTNGYGLHLTASHWILDGFTLRQSAKGIVTDGARYNILRNLEVSHTGHEAVHFRTFSSDNTIQNSWIHHTGLTQPLLGEGVYVGSAYANWRVYTAGNPDTSDRNHIVGNVIGPSVTAEHIDIKEGTSEGSIRENVFIGTHQTAANSWIDLKGNRYLVQGNTGVFITGRKFREAVSIVRILDGWGLENQVDPPEQVEQESVLTEPYRALYAKTDEMHIILRARALPYSLHELRVRFPHAFEQLDDTTLLLREHILVRRDAHLVITQHDTRRLRLLSTPERFVTIVSYRGTIRLEGAEGSRLDIQSWNPATGEADHEIMDGRAYVLARGGRMDVTRVDFADLGFAHGILSGVAWRSAGSGNNLEITGGDVTQTSFTRNYFGAYTYEAEYMHWTHNVFADNLVYGFDPHDFSNHFVVEHNRAFGNGSHGIIFSRGCDNNILRYNESHDNAGHGIMIDDGRAAFGSDGSVVRSIVTSDNNIIESNQIWNNHDGIVIEGGSGNVVHRNDIRGTHRYGVRVTEAALETQITANTIAGEARIGVYIYNRSNGSLVANNNISAQERGVIIVETTDTMMERNTIAQVSQAAIVLEGDISGTLASDNTLSGAGKQPIDLRSAAGVDLEDLLNGNHTIDWQYATLDPNENLMYAALTLWVFMLGAPLIMATLYRIKTLLRG
jgi:parallel beta-helix repeat protein